MTTPELVQLAKVVALKHGLDPTLVCAVIEQESAWDTDAIRYEPAFFDRYVLPLNLANATEARGRAFSWGLMQVMGQVARENGYKGRYFTTLCSQPEVGLEVGCTVLRKKLNRANMNIAQGLLYWNGGGRKEYSGEVMGRMSKYA